MSSLLRLLRKQAGLVVFWCPIEFKCNDGNSALARVGAELGLRPVVKSVGAEDTHFIREELLVATLSVLIDLVSALKQGEKPDSAGYLAVQD